jgi:hypothetical protein
VFLGNLINGLCEILKRIKNSPAGGKLCEQQFFKLIFLHRES